MVYLTSHCRAKSFINDWFSMQRFYVPQIQVRHNCLILYDQETTRPARSAKLFDISKLKGYTGTTTAGSMKRIGKAVDILIQKSPEQIIYNPVSSKYMPFSLNFVTLTIPHDRIITAREGYPLLKETLRNFRRQNANISYIWKAELQQKGQLHYHLTTNTFLHYQYIRDAWNRQLKKAGLLEGYRSRHGGYNANSTDVHAVWKVKNVAAYLSKYLSKTDDKAKISGKVWDCSNSLKINRFNEELDTTTEKNIHMAMQRKSTEVVRLEHCTIIKLKEPERLLSAELKNNYETWKKAK